jgi:hypothetical protein
MCSDDPHRRTRRRYLRPGLLMLAGSLAAAAAGCGKQGPPTPPLRLVPARTEDLAVRQRGTEAVLSFEYPQTTPGGGELNGLSQAEILEAVQPAPSGAAPEALDPKQFATLAKVRVKLPAKEIGANTLGNKVQISLPLPSPLPAVPEAHFYAVRTFGTKGDRSELSNQAILVAKTTPPAPEAVKVTPRPNGILVEWTPPVATAPVAAPGVIAAAPAAPAAPAAAGAAPAAPAAAGAAPAAGAAKPAAPAAGAPAGTPAPPSTKAPPGAAAAPPPAPAAPTIGAYNVYRRFARERVSSQPIAVVRPPAKSFLDASASFGQSYIYSVTSVDGKDPLVESAVRSESEIHYLNRFPPPAPADLVAVGEADRVRLVWQGVEAANLAGYLVYRQGPGGEFARVSDQPVQTPGYVDTTAAAGQTYVYRVTAIDKDGNESPPSAEARVTAQ